jgi:hypothetical protein
MFLIIFHQVVRLLGFLYRISCHMPRYWRPIAAVFSVNSVDREAAGRQRQPPASAVAYWNEQQYPKRSPAA